MKQYINTSNYYLGALATVINATDETGTFEVDSIENDGVTLPVKGFFWLDVDFDSAGQREIFRIVSRVGTTLTFDKRISPYGKFRHEEGAAVGLRDFAELFNSLASNTDNFGQVEQLSNTTIKVYGGNVYIQGGATRTIPTREVIISPNNLTQFLYFNPFADAGEEFVVTTEQNNSLYHLANITTDTSSITGITDMRGTYIGTSMEGLQTEDNMRSNLDNPNNITYPTTEAVKNAIDDAISHSGGGGSSALLGGWDAEEGLAESFARDIPYSYKNGDYFIINNIKYWNPRKEMFGDYHIPTSNEWRKITNILDILHPFTPTGDSEDSFIEFALCLGYLKMPMYGAMALNTSPLNLLGVSGGEGFILQGYQTCEYGTGNILGTPLIGQGGYAFNFFSHGEGGELTDHFYPHGNISVYPTAAGLPIRLFADTPTQPGAGRTTLLAGSGGAGIYWNQSLGLISLSSDGTDWITIKDKNEGATEVAKYIPYAGDDVSNEFDFPNSMRSTGNSYQWGNCCGFSVYGPYGTTDRQVNGGHGTSDTTLGLCLFYSLSEPDWNSSGSGSTNELIHAYNLIWGDAATKSDWVDLLAALYNLGITSYEDVVRYLHMPLAGYLYTDYIGPGGEQVAGEWGNDGKGYYWCYDEDAGNTTSGHMITLNAYDTPDTCPITGVAQDLTHVKKSCINVRGWFDGVNPLTDTDNTWTKIYSGTGNAGIYITDNLRHNNVSYSVGGITVSSDGVTWYTICDRNYFASDRYNYGDEITPQNSGGYHQWNKGFAFFPNSKYVGDEKIRLLPYTSYDVVDVDGIKPYCYNEYLFILMSDISGILTGANWMLGGNSNLWKYTGGEVQGDNYRPNGSVYTGNPSQTLEQQNIAIGATYTYFNGEWMLGGAVSVSFSDILGYARDNADLNRELDLKQNKLTPDMGIQIDNNSISSFPSLVFKVNATSENSADVDCTFNQKTNFSLTGDIDADNTTILSTTIGIEADAESGDSIVVMGEILYHTEYSLGGHVSTSIGDNTGLGLYIKTLFVEVYDKETVQKLIQESIEREVTICFPLFDLALDIDSAVLDLVRRFENLSQEGGDIVYDFDGNNSAYYNITYTPNQDFEISCLSTAEGMTFHILINGTDPVYNITLGTGVSNPFNLNLTLTANKTTLITLYAPDGSNLWITDIKTEA